MIRRQGESRHRDRLEGYHPKPGVAAAAKIARRGTPVFALIEVERLMMWVGQKRDAMLLLRNPRGLGLVGCNGSPCVGERGEGTWGGQNEGGMNNRSTTEVDNEICKAPEKKRDEKKKRWETYRKGWTKQTALSVILWGRTERRERGWGMGEGGRGGWLREARNNLDSRPSSQRRLLIH